MTEPIFLTPVCKDYLWGGNRLREEFYKESPADKIAETWELACHKDGSSLLRDGALAGTSLQCYLETHRELLGTRCADAETLPVLIKLIDAKQDLSIQVHPEDAYAYANEGEPGKTEMWYILDATPGAALYYGVNRPVSKEEFAKRIQEETLPEVLHRVEVKPGELYFIPAGTLHAIGAGILLAEIQQNSNTTYRVYDYGRRDAAGNLRELHVEKAQAVAKLTPSEPTVQYAPKSIPGGTVRKLASCAYFATDVVTVEETVSFVVPAETFHHLLVIDGTGTLETETGTYKLKKGDSVLLPANLGTYRISGRCQYLETRIEF
jgi:mannose-6-phosphate isomerase